MKNGSVPNEDIIWGINPVEAVLDSEPGRIHKLHLLEGRRNPRLQQLLALAREAGVPVSFGPRRHLDRLSSGAHQGVVAVLGARPFSDWQEAVRAAADRGETPLLVVLDHLQDPQNLGAVARSAAAFGAHALVVPRHRSAAPGGAADKAAAGALRTLPLARVTNLSRALTDMKENGLWVLGTVVDSGSPPEQLDLRVPLALVIGAEEKGLRPVTSSACDMLTTIPLTGTQESLNASVAAGVILYEISRQRAGASR